MMRFHVLTFVLLAANANASFLRNQQEQQRNLDGLDNLSKFGLDPSYYRRLSCPQKQCHTVSFFKSIDPSILETDTECTSAASCTSGYACLYDNTTSATKFVCEENLDAEGKCNLLCVQDDCYDERMCLPLSTIVDASLEIECTSTENCPFGECRYDTDTHKLLCDTSYGSLCGYDCVEDDSQEIAAYRDSTQSVACLDNRMCLPLSTLVGVVIGECKSTEDCALGECRYYSNTGTTVCDKPDGTLCGYDCVEDDSQEIPAYRDSTQPVVCSDNRMCLPLSWLDVAMEECKGPEDCPLGECRYNSDTKTTVCDTGDPSLCVYDCVEDDSTQTEIP